MTDVAHEAGVSVSTVSLALSGKQNTGISAPTIKRIQKATTTLGYVPPKSGAQAATLTRRLIVLMEDLLANPIGHLMMGGISSAAAQEGIQAAFLLEDLSDPSVGTLRAISAESPIGVIIATSYSHEIEIPDVSFDVPTILLNCWSNSGEFISVLPNDKLGADRATGHLLDSGSKRIACLCGEPWLPAYRDRIQGWRNAHSDRQLVPDDDLLMTGPADFKSGYSHASALLKLPKPPDAMFCGNDWLALGAYQAITAAGRLIPKDISVVGFDDQRFAAELVPPLTTVMLPYNEMGKVAAEIALKSPNLIKNGSLMVDSKLVKRSSVR